MIGLRQVAKKDAASEEDLEAPKDEGKGPSTSRGASPSGATYNPLFLAKAVLRKVVAILLASDDGGIATPGGILALLRDVILGLIVGVIFISAFIVLDHFNVFRSQGAQNFRGVAFHLLNDPETLATVEESSDLRFMTAAEYDSKRKEVEDLPNKKANLDDVFRRRKAEVEESEKEIEAIKDEYQSLKKNPLLELDKFCGECIWAGKVTCDERVKFLEGTWNTRPLAGMVSAMEVATCKKQ